jgi:hypothetical protein
MGWFLQLEVREFANGMAISSQTQTVERRASLAATLVRHDDQFEYSNDGEFNRIVLDLAYGFQED